MATLNTWAGRWDGDFPLKIWRNFGRMRTLIASGDYYPNLGGVTSLFNDMARALMARGHEVTILTRQSRGLLPAQRWNGYQILRLDHPMFFELAFDRAFALRSPSILRRVHSILRERQIETVCIGLLDLSALYLLLLRPVMKFRLIL